MTRSCSKEPFVNTCYLPIPDRRMYFLDIFCCSTIFVLTSSRIRLTELPVSRRAIINKVQKKTEKAKKEAGEKKETTPKGVILTKTQAKGMAPAKTAAKKSLKRATDSDGFQLPPKYLTVKADKLNSYTSLPTVQTSPPTTSSKGDEGIS
ncbi:hypothetical protein NPIL_605211 [Nephila pilipes]|uniref:Uncharacterized protein n=1 Tax=Nephila pilipes TaxID=299642 RepID=A0A8X6U9I8_NEPPI|nr:hypothetical protein NPIL_605211 [Nephila pilipes]